MRIISATKYGIAQAATLLKFDGVIVYPTDTAYGLGGKFNSKKVRNEILKIKKRRDPKFTIIASSLAQVEKFFKLSKEEKKLAKKYWPGPLSIVVSKEFAVRVPDNDVARSLARRTGVPLIATSANISGGQTPYSSKEIVALFSNKKNKPAGLIDAGRLRKVKPSTIIKAENNHKIEILRQGSLKI